MLQKNKEYVMLGLAIVVIMLVTGFPLLTKGVGGDTGDLTYHLLRIASMKEAIVNGAFPPRVSPIYANGYGYGSSLFYPDIFLVFPALFSIMGASLLLSYKIFVFLIMVAGSCTTYFSLKFISGDSKSALLGSTVLMLSNFYIADINNRSGVSEYLACAFVPLLVAGIYDYFAFQGKRTYLLGVGFVGLALSHTIMTFIGAVVTTLVFAGMLLVPRKRKLVFEKKRFARLFITGVMSVLVAGYYVFPMLEQFVDGWFLVGAPWAKVGSFTQTLEDLFAPVGIFVFTAKFGVGIALLVWIAGRVVLGRVKNRWADFFLVIGLLLLLGMTDLVVPWKLLENTPFNMIQFTYRFYPYVLFFLVCGMTICYAEKSREGVIGRTAFGTIALLAVICGVWQNKYCMDNTSRTDISDAFVYENDTWVGHGEWYPCEVATEVCLGNGEGVVYSAYGDKLPWTVTGYLEYEFMVTEETGLSCMAPLIYYKGYEAGYELDGEWHKLPVSKSSSGLVEIEFEQPMETVITVRYGGTFVQMISNIISVVTVIGLVGLGLYRGRKRKKQKEEIST